MRISRQRKKEWLIAGAVIFVIMGLFTLNLWRVYGTEEWVTVRVVRTERVVQGSGDSASSRYLVFTDGETFQNTDSIFHGKFRSSDLYGRLKAGKRYRCRVYGWRIPFLSGYRNIIEARAY